MLIKEGFLFYSLVKCMYSLLLNNYMRPFLLNLSAMWEKEDVRQIRYEEIG